MIRLWGRKTSSNVMKVLFLLDELGLPYERRDVGGAFGGTATPEYRAMHPIGLVPAIQDDDLTLFESNAILRYLCNAHAPTSPLYPADAKTAGYLIPLVETIGERAVDGLTPREIRGLGPALYPAASTDTWTRQVVTPVRAVRNHAHDLGKAAPIRIKGYTREERVAQDLARGRTSRVAKTPGSWEWLLRFREHADRRHAALAHFMFVTGARVSQSVAMHPCLNLDLPQARALIPAAKGHAARWVDLTPELVAELANLPLLYPRGVERKPKNARLFGFADRSSPRKGWLSACTKAKIAPLGFHAAGRHGFGQEMNVRQGIDEKAASKVGGWADTALMKRTYTHAEDASGKVHKALRRGRLAAEKTTKLKLAGN